MAYVTGEKQYQIMPINGMTQSIETAITVENIPSRIVSDSYRSIIYAVNPENNSLSILKRNDSETIIPVGKYPMDLSISQDGYSVYVLNQKSYSVSILDTVTEKITTMTDIGPAPSGIAISSHKRYLAVSNQTGSLNVYDLTKKGYAMVILGVDIFPGKIAITHDEKYVYVCSARSSSVVLVDIQTMTKVGEFFNMGMPTDIVIDSKDQYVYVTDHHGHQVFVINHKTRKLETSSILVGTNPQGLALSSDGTFLYVANSGTNTVSAIELATKIEAKISIKNFTPLWIATG